jgi:exodeoxyribonuclease VII large subunit
MDNLIYLKNNLEDFLTTIDINIICGEITSIKNKNPHQYIDIKNNGISISCCSWGVQHNFMIGNKVKISGYCSLSKFNMSIQFIIKKIELIEDQKNTEHSKIIELKNKLINLNIIGNEKRQLDKCPLNIALITSTTGAVINDIKHVFNNSNLFGSIYIYNVLVQGEKCSSSICEAINYFNTKNEIDIILIARGGGEKEHIACFSNEDILMHVHNSKHIIACGIGHEEDDPLINYVASYSCSTPTNLAHLIVNFQQKYKIKLNNIKLQIENYESKFYNLKNKFNLINYNEKIKNMKYEDVKQKLNMKKKYISNILYNYEKSKNSFIKQLQQLKPIIYKNDVEILSVKQFEETNKKLKIKCFDGEIFIQYQIKNLK